MKEKQKYSAIVSKGKVAFVSYCPELGVASQGKTKANALKNLKEAVELYLEETTHSKLAKIPQPTITTFTA
ncbi:MAG: type II toxin-antitoxin system HicB family antitoxin [Candidatus Micrarchaeia archaeon]